MNLYKEIFSELEKADISYLIVGGVAVNLYGYNRFTGDIDILLALNEKNLEKLDRLMHKLGYTERQPVSVKDLGNEKKLKKFMKEKGMKAFTFISSEKPQLDLDIIVKESKDFEKYNKRKKYIEVWGIKLPVCHIDDLIKIKKFMKTTNFNIKQLKRNKYSSPESKLDWLFSALCFAQSTKKIVSGKKSSK